jgi:outer membrane protein
MLKRMALVGILAATMIVVGLPNAHAGEQLKIGCVDPQRVLNECRAGKEAKGILDDLMKVRKRELQAKEDKIKNLQDELAKQLMLSDEAKAKRDAEIKLKTEEYRKSVKEVSQELYKREAELTEPILRDIKDAIERLGKEKGFSIILTKNDILYGADELDLTDKITKMLDEKSR